MDNLLSLKNKTVLVVGASSGIGAHYAKTAAKVDAKLILAARRLDRFDK